MNRFFAETFAFSIGAIHVLFLLGMALALLGLVLDWPPSEAVTTMVGELGAGMPTPVVLALVFAGYVLTMGVVSTLIAINQNLERLARDVDRRGGYEAST